MRISSTREAAAGSGPARWAVWLALAVAMALAAPASAGGLISAPEAHAKSQAGELLIIDVRSPREWRASGVPAGARRVTIHNPRGAAGFLEDILAAVAGDKTRPLGLICARGARSDRAHRFLHAKGFTEVVDIGEGMLGQGAQPGWIARGLPVEPCGRC